MQEKQRGTGAADVHRDAITGTPLRKTFEHLPIVANPAAGL